MSDEQLEPATAQDLALVMSEVKLVKESIIEERNGLNKGIQEVLSILSSQHYYQSPSTYELSQRLSAQYDENKNLYGRMGTLLHYISHFDNFNIMSSTPWERLVWLMRRNLVLILITLSCVAGSNYLASTDRHIAVSNTAQVMPLQRLSSILFTPALAQEQTVKKTDPLQAIKVSIVEYGMFVIMAVLLSSMAVWVFVKDKTRMQIAEKTFSTTLGFIIGLMTGLLGIAPS